MIYKKVIDKKWRRLAERTSISLLSSTAMLICAPAFAQDSEDAAQGGVDVITVTARKRAESAQDVPIQVTAIAGEQVERLDITSIERIAARVPNLTVGRSSNGSGAQIALRGVGSLSTSPGVEQSVAVVVDGAYYGQGRIINEGFFDLGRVEVINGPQALFFGKNATAGVINIETADPGETPEFQLRSAYEIEGEQWQVDGVASGPLTDTLGARIAVRYSNMTGGYFRNLAAPQQITTTDVATGAVTTATAPPAALDQPGEEELIGRLTLQWNPTEIISNELKVQGTVSDNNNASWNYVTYQCATGFSSLDPAAPCARDFVVRQNNFPEQLANFPLSRANGELFNRYRSYAINNSLNIDLDKVLLTSVTNYQWNNNQFAIMGDFQSSPAPTWATEDSTWRAFSEELRALTQFDGPFNFMIGGLFQTTKRDFDQPVFFPFLVTDSSAPQGLEAVTVRKDSETEGETFAVFAQAVIDITPELELSGGLRYTHEEKDSFFVQTIVNPAVAAVFRPADSPDGLGTITANQEFNDVSPDVTLRWRPLDDVMLFGSYRQAYKSGGFSNGGLNSFFSSDPLGDLTFDEETAEGFEAGFKSLLFDRQLRFNLTGYRFNYNDFQVDFFNSSLIAFQTLGADARTTGVELQVEYAPAALPGLNLHGALNYTDAKYTSFPDAPCFAGQTPAQGCNLIFDAGTGALRPIAGAEVGVRQDLAGAPLSVAAEWTGQAGFLYEGRMGPDLDFTVGADVRFSSDYIPSGFGQIASRQDAYATVDAFASIGRENWELAFIGKNLTNEFYVTGAVDGPSTGSGTGTPAGVQADQIGFAALPRTMQLRATLRY